MDLHLPFDARPDRISRRRISQLMATAAASPLLLAFYPDHESTHRVSEGPAYKTGSLFLLICRVFSTTDKPISQALVVLWNVQNNGKYDFDGFNLRGRQLTAKDGRFEFLTIEAIPYGSRTAHFHFKLSAPGFEPLTTELYLPGLAQNSRDSSFRTSNLLQKVDETGIRKGRYEFYLRPA